MPQKQIRLALAVMVAMVAQAAHARPVVLELFTSQGCSSCPPADALLAQLQAEPDIIPLSYHVDYWDTLGWKDPLSSPAMTQRQRDYSHALGQNNVFTPQLVINGHVSEVGSNESAVRAAIDAAKHEPSLHLTLQVDDAKQRLVIMLPASQSITTPAAVYAVHYIARVTTQVARGENGGHTLDNINNVTHIEKMGEWQPQKAVQYELAVPLAEEGVAVLVQTDGQGAIIGAANYTKAVRPGVGIR